MQLTSTLIFKASLIFYFIFGMHVSTFTPGAGGLYITSNIIGWIVIALGIGCSCFEIYRKREITFSFIHIYTLIAILLLLVPAFYNDTDFFDFSSRYIAILGATLFYGAIYQFSNLSKNDILYLLALAVAIEAVIGIIQMLFFDSSIVDLNSYQLVEHRPFGVFRQPNVFASFIATGIFISLYLLNKMKEKSYKVKATWPLYFNLVCGPALLILTQSKVGYLGFIISLILLLPILLKNIKHYKNCLLLLCLGIIIGGFLSSQFQGFDRGETKFKDNGIRTDMFSMSVQMIQENTLEGVGYGNFQRKYLDKHVASIQEGNDLYTPTGNMAHPHNELLYWGVEGGIVALLSFLVLGIGLFKLIQHKNLNETLLGLSVLLPIILHTQTEFPFYTSIPHLLFVVLLVYNLDGSKLFIRKIDNVNLFKVFGFLIPLIVSTLMLTTLHTSYKVQEFRESGYKDMDSFQQIVNYFTWNSYFDEFFNNAKFVMASKNNNSQALQEYLDWAYLITRKEPRQKHYRNMDVAIKILKKNKILVDPNIEKTVRLEYKLFYNNSELINK